jgi:hypothetical protein
MVAEAQGGPADLRQSRSFLYLYLTFVISRVSAVSQAAGAATGSTAGAGLFLIRRATVSET